MRIEVTKRDISAGRRGSCFSCPVAKALYRAGFCGVGVSRNSIGVKSARGRTEYIPTPASVARFIGNFDRGRPVSPFSFNLDIPEVA